MSLKPRMARRDLMKEGLKPSLATTHAKASERVIADSLSWEDARGRIAKHGLFPALRKKTVPSLNPKPRTQCHTSATSLRKQISKLRVSDPPDAGQRTRTCAAAIAPRMALMVGTPLPRDKSLHG